jgi:hypothetical protein
LSVSFHFGTGKTFTSHCDPSVEFPARDPIPLTGFGGQASESSTATGEPGDDKTEDIEAAGFVAGRVGEEDETVVQDMSATLYAFDGEQKKWVERGSGRIRLNRGKGRHRLVLHRTAVGTVALNLDIVPETRPEAQIAGAKRSTQIRFLGHLPPQSGEEAKFQPMLLRLKSPEDAEALLASWKEAIANARPGSSVSQDDPK